MSLAAETPRAALPLPETQTGGASQGICKAGDLLSGEDLLFYIIYDSDLLAVRHVQIDFVRDVDYNFLIAWLSDEESGAFRGNHNLPAGRTERNGGTVRINGLGYLAQAPASGVQPEC